MVAPTQHPDVNLQENRGPEIVRAVAIPATLAAIAVFCRLVARRLKHLDLRASDYTVIFGLIGAWAIAGGLIAEANLGLGKHVEVVPLTNLISYAGAILYATTLPTIKLSILLFYHDLLFPSRKFSLYLGILGAAVVAWGIAVLVCAIHPCNPIHGFWDFTIVSKCINPRTFYIATSVPNILTDLAILCVPVTEVWKLHMSKKQKAVVSTMFMMGSFVVVASIIRFVYVFSFSESDPTWTSGGIGTWSSVETSTAVLSACLPTLRPVLMCVLPKSLQFGSTKVNTGTRPRTRSRSRIISQEKSLEANSSETDLTGSMQLREYTTYELARPHRAFSRTAIKGGFDVDGHEVHQQGIRVQRGFSTDPSGIWTSHLDDKRYFG